MENIHINKDTFKEQTAEFIDQSFENVKPEKKLGIRHLQVLNAFFFLFVTHYSRNGFSVAIVAMNDRNSTINPNIPTFQWTNKNVVQSSFFFGEVPSHIITAFLITKFGAKWFSLILMVCSAILGILIPTVAYNFKDKGVIVVRILQGVALGSALPSIEYLLARWVPINERARLSVAVYSASTIATVMTMFVNGYVAGSWLGWPWIFYISTILVLIWCISFFLFSYDSPTQHPTISVKERKYIQRSLRQENMKQNPKIPWKALLTSMPFWALSLTNVAFSWGYWTLEAQMPLYMKHVMKFQIESSGSLSALPYLIQCLCSYFFAYISDYLLQKKIWTIVTARKTMNSIGMFLPAIILIMIQNSGSDESTKAVILLVIGVAINGACFCGFMVNYIDLSPTFASIMMGLSNGTAQVTGFLAPLFVQAVVKNDADPNQWKYVFYTAAGIYIFAGLIFIFFAKGEVQDWDSDKNEKK